MTDTSKPNPDWVTPPDGTIVAVMCDDTHGFRKMVMRNGKAVMEEFPEGQCDGDGQEDEDED